MTDEEKTTFAASAETALTAILPSTFQDTDSNMPIMEGDVLTFKVPDKGTAMDVLLNVPASVQPASNGRPARNINAWAALVTADGRRVSFTQLFKRPGNGLGLSGATPKARCIAFLTLLQERNEISVTVNKVRIQPSTTPGADGMRILMFGPIA